MPKSPLVLVTPLLAALTLSPLGAQPLAAQDAPLRSVCTREVKKAPEPPRPKKPAEARRDSARESLRMGAREIAVRHAAANGVEAPRGVIVFRALDDGLGGELVAHRTNLPDSVLGVIEREAGPLFAQWPRESTPYTSVRLDSIPIPEVAIGEVTTSCRPELLHREMVARAMSDFTQANPRVLRSRAQSVTVQFFLTREGAVLAPFVEKSSGNALLDDFAVALVPRLLFRVAEIDGVPVDVWNRMPFSIRLPREQPRVPGAPSPFRTP